MEATLSIVGAIAGAAVSIFTLIKLAPIRKLWRKTLGRRGAQLDRIEAELTPNHGSSLRDAIDRIQKRVERVDAIHMAFLATRDEAVFITNAEGDCTWTSPTYQRLVGRSSQELCGKGWINVFPQRLRIQVSTEWYDNTVAAERNFEYTTVLTNGPGGDEFHAIVSAQRMTAAGQVLGYLGVVKPVKEIE